MKILNKIKSYFTNWCLLRQDKKIRRKLFLELSPTYPIKESKIILYRNRDELQLERELKIVAIMGYKFPDYAKLYSRP